MSNLQLGKRNQLKVLRKKDHGVYLEGGEIGDILLPKRYVPEGTKEGDILDVFLYLDHEERLTATTEHPLIEVGQFAYLECTWTNEYGAYLNWGLMKDLFCPFREQKVRMQKGKRYLVYCYIDDKTYRIVCSSKVEKFQNAISEKNGTQNVRGAESHTSHSPHPSHYENASTPPPDRKVLIGDFSTRLYEHLKLSPNGFSPYHDKSPAEEIYAMFGVSKKVFKQAVGDLYKRQLIKILPNGIELVTLVLLLFLTLPLSAQKLTQAETEREAQRLTTQWIADTKARCQETWQNQTLTINGKQMPFWHTIYGEKPADGYSLFISLHGGGNAPAQLNDSQWENQKVLYTPKNSVYLAPRAPYNDWDMWFKPDLDSFYAALIQMCVAYLDVNPDKVYLIGYSAGGDGVWRMGPRMADTWAGASMMAGHPGDVSLLNLRNIPFMIWCGAQDAAYNRNTECTKRGLEMDSLQNNDPEGYRHQTHIVKGKAHWMDLEDAAALPWLQQYKRNPYPTQIVWQQTDVPHAHFYWLTAPSEQLQRGKTVRLALKGNTVNIQQCDYTQLTLHFNDQMLNLDHPVTIKFKGKTLFKGKLQRTLANLQNSLSQRGDLQYMFPAQTTVKIP
ncbi:MAG: hypothetical protein IJ693_04770 [Bacteroidaceae bacterium]|nr:hypothetical protein [Bacteroidaceae bacterium]